MEQNPSTRYCIWTRRHSRTFLLRDYKNASSKVFMLSLKGNDTSRNLAWHATSLKNDKLLRKVPMYHENEMMEIRRGNNRGRDLQAINIESNTLLLIKFSCNDVSSLTTIAYIPAKMKATHSTAGERASNSLASPSILSVDHAPNRHFWKLSSTLQFNARSSVTPSYHIDSKARSEFVSDTDIYQWPQQNNYCNGLLPRSWYLYVKHPAIDKLPNFTDPRTTTQSISDPTLHKLSCGTIVYENNKSEG